jgi:hypothetical protein
MGAPARSSLNRFSGQRHVVSGALVWRRVAPFYRLIWPRKGFSLDRHVDRERFSALAGDGDIFAAAGMGTAFVR